MRIGIVNDSVMAAEVLHRIIYSSMQHEVIWTASNGAEAIMRCNQKKPDLILMDLMMPVMNGVEATRRIMKSTPCAILIVTASVDSNSSMVFEAMGVGALDVVSTPVIGLSDENISSNKLIHKVDMISKLIGCHHNGNGISQKLHSSNDRPVKKELNLVAIGASTGGPQALIEVLSNFPKDFPAAVVVIQHMDKKFTANLASWLRNQLFMPVKLVEEGDRPIQGTIYVPCTDNHLVMNNTGTFGYTNNPQKNFYHPSVDVFFKSINSYWHGRIIGTLLTGMGRDGANGLLELKEKGHHTISQDEETSIVYGMPKAANDIGAAVETLPLPKIGPKILSLIER